MAGVCAARSEDLCLLAICLLLCAHVSALLLRSCGHAGLTRSRAAGQSPITTSNIARLASRTAPAFHPTASLFPGGHIATPDPSTCVYVPYRHTCIHTGDHAPWWPLRLDATTGTRVPIVLPPNGFVATQGDGADEPPPNFFKWFAEPTSLWRARGDLLAAEHGSIGSQ